MFQKNLSLAPLYDRYAPLLSEKQRTVFSLYYDEDYSLSEIGEHTGTTRQAVRELIAHTEKQLCLFEENLGLCQKEKKLLALAGELYADGSRAMSDTEYERLVAAIKE